jgi:hypothetical protein
MITEKDKKRIKKIMNLWRNGKFNTIYAKYVSPTYKEIVNNSLNEKVDRNTELDFKEMLDERVENLLPKISGYSIKEIKQGDFFHIINVKAVIKDDKRTKTIKIIFLREDEAFKPSKSYKNLYLNPTSIRYSQRYSKIV